MSEENERVLYCYECSHIGMVKHPALACCPDSKGAYVPPEVAEQAKIGFGVMYVTATAAPADPACEIADDPTDGA